MTEIKKDIKNEENVVIDTAGGEMPDPSHPVQEKASHAADVFNQDEPLKKTEAQQELKKKAS